MCQCNDPEVWAPVTQYVGFYEVSTCGRVRSMDRTVIDCNGHIKPVRGQLLRPTLSRLAGYPYVSLCVLGVSRKRMVHHLVLETFVGPRPPGLDGCHWDNDPKNNHTVNLRWDTVSSNMLDKQRHGTDHQRNKTHCPIDHLLVAPNLVANRAAQGTRYCLACHRASGSKSYYARRGRPFNFRVEADRHYHKIMRPTRIDRPPAPAGLRLEVVST